MSHDWQHTAVHIAKHALESERAKEVMKTAGAALAAAAPPALLAVAAPIAPFLFIGAVGYGIYWLFTE